MFRSIGFFLLMLCLFMTQNLLATHNRAGEITYEHLSGNTYRFTVRICSNEGSNVADRPELEIQWGDGTIDTVPRLSETFLPPVGSFNGSDNLYVMDHTFPGPNTYNIKVLDPNRNQGIENIVSSVNVAFCIQTTLVINPFLGNNNSSLPQDFPCPEIGCVGQRYCYNSVAYDPDGDSLSYELVPCLGDDCLALPIPAVYQYPQTVGGGVISIDPLTGTLCWDAPQLQGEYNIAVKISEWRNGFFVGAVLRDIQITILGVCNNNPPVLTELADTCIEAGQFIQFNMSASDPDPDQVNITGYGQPFDFTSSPAVLNPNSPGNPANATFQWSTNCSHIRNAPYQMFFMAEDNDPTIPLTDIRAFYVRVLPNRVTNLTANPSGNSIVLNWDPHSCFNIKGYKIYRRLGNGPPPGNCCEESTPVDLGYSLIGTVIGQPNNSFIDNTSLLLGQQFCYVVVAYMVDGATSCPSNEACAELILDVPIITHNSVGITDVAAGVDTVQWVHPFELDTISNFPPPYFYEVYRADGFGNPATLIYTTPQSLQLFSTEKEVIVPNLNTDSQANTYRIDMYNVVGGNPQYIGSTNTASSVFLSITPSDNALNLTWTENVPWSNHLYEVYKETPSGSGNFSLIGSTTQQNYKDSGLVNGANYCYRIKSLGHYSVSELPDTLENWSQTECGSPTDLTPPCAPELHLSSDCLVPINELWWYNPNNFCADDVMSYSLFYSETDTGKFQLIATFNSQFDTTYSHINDYGSIAGCYYLTATDSVQYGNESLPSNIVCADNCPSYFLPNVFSPNGDGENDFFIPFPYRFVKDIELRIYNRWGQVIFETTDPDINWDGKHMENGQDVPEGVYYYFCKVNTIRLTGIEPVELTGFFHLYREGNARSN